MDLILEILKIKNITYIEKYLKKEHYFLKLICHCGVFFETRKDCIKKDSFVGCSKCSREKGKIKSQQTNLNKYGCISPFGNKEVQNKAKQTNIKKYGTENYTQTNEYKHTCLEKYGVEYYFQTQECKKKITQTNLSKYGVKNYSQTEEFKEKLQNTCKEKYGVIHYSQTETFKKKAKNTNIKKYGVDHYSKTMEYQNKINQTNLHKYGVTHYSQTEDYLEKMKQSNLERYGVEHYSKTEEYKNRIKQTNFEKYGVLHYSQTEDYLEKMKQSNLERYGVNYYTQAQEFKNQMIEKYGVDNYSKTEECKAKIKQTNLSSGRTYSDESFLSKIQTIKPETGITEVRRLEGKEWEFTHSEYGKWTKKCTSGILSVTPHKIDQFLLHLNGNFTCKEIENNLYEITNYDLNLLPFRTQELKQTYEFKKHFFSETIILDLLNNLTYNYQSNIRNIDIEMKYSCKFKTLIEHIDYKFVEYYNHSIHECTEEEWNSLQLDHSIPQQFFKKYFPLNWEKLANHYSNVKYLKNLKFENQKKGTKYLFNEKKVLQWYREGNVVFPEHLYDFAEERKILNL